MKIRRNLGLSRKALLRHRVRTALAISGTAIGVAAVLVMVAIGEGAERALLAQVEAMGGNLLVVTAGRAEPLIGRTSTAGLVNTLKPTDAEAIARRSPAVERTAASLDQNLQLKYDILAMRTSVRATSADYEQIRDFRAERGRYFTPEEDESGQRVTVIGSRVAETLFAGVDPIGEIVRVGRVPFEVIGVLESKGSSTNTGTDEDNQILIPLRTGLRRVFNTDYVTLVYVQVRDEADMDLAAAQVSGVLRDRHRLDERGLADDFRIENQLLVLEAEREASSSFQRLILLLAAVALLVGGVGILSIMLLSIRERRNEIGLRIAVGAKRWDVRLQFVVEALMLGIVGGVVGLAAGLSVAAGVGRWTQWQTAVSGEAVALALAAALTISFVFGVLPAHRAAAQDPIESLRAE